LTRISLHELHILSFGCGTGGHILHRLERKLALHILEREQVLFVRLSDDLVKSRCGLGAEKVTRLDKLGGSTFTCHVRSGAV
jgi:hypothetical protein